MPHTPSVQSTSTDQTPPLVSTITSTPTAPHTIHRKPVPDVSLSSTSSETLPALLDKELPPVPFNVARTSISQSISDINMIPALLWEDLESWQDDSYSASSFWETNESVSTVSHASFSFDDTHFPSESMESLDADTPYTPPAPEMPSVFKELHVHNLHQDWLSELERSKPSWAAETSEPSKKKKSKKSKKRQPSFHESKMPSLVDIFHASKLPVISSSGIRVPFGDLFQDQKTIVCFIRHFFCPLCQDYMHSISQGVDKKDLDERGVKLVIISNGSWEMIQGYEKIFDAPFNVYTDPTLDLYKAMGMTLQTASKGQRSRRGSYVKHNDLSGTWMVIKNAVKHDMPLLKDAGKITQLGGEFILGPGPQCSFAHRMRYTADHASITEVLNQVGIFPKRPILADSTSPVELTACDNISCPSQASFAPSDAISCPSVASSAPCGTTSCSYEASDASSSASSYMSDTSTIIGEDDLDWDFSFPLPPDRTVWIGKEDVGPNMMKLKLGLLNAVSQRYSMQCSSAYCGEPTGLAYDEEEFSPVSHQRYSTQCSSTYCGEPTGLSYDDDEVSDYDHDVPAMRKEVARFALEVDSMLSVF